MGLDGWLMALQYAMHEKKREVEHHKSTTNSNNQDLPTQIHGTNLPTFNGKNKSHTKTVFT